MGCQRGPNNFRGSFFGKPNEDRNHNKGDMTVQNEDIHLYVYINIYIITFAIIIVYYYDYTFDF
jgi:hypothetical protein